MATFLHFQKFPQSFPTLLPCCVLCSWLVVGVHKGPWGTQMAEFRSSPVLADLPRTNLRALKNMTPHDFAWSWVSSNQKSWNRSKSFKSVFQIVGSQWLVAASCSGIWVRSACWVRYMHLESFVVYGVSLWRPRFQPILKGVPGTAFELVGHEVKDKKYNPSIVRRVFL